MRAQEVLHVFNAELLRGRGAVGELFGVGDLHAEDLFPGERVARLVVVGRTAFRGSDGRAEVEVVVDPLLGGLVATLFDGAFDHARSDDDVFRIRGVDLVHHEVVRDVDDFVVLHAAGHPGVALVDGELPGFVRIGDRVGAAFREVAVLAEEVDGDVNGVAGARRTFGHQTADAVADAAVLDGLNVFFVDARAGVRDDRDAVFIDEAVRERGARRVVGLRPVEGVGVFDLRDFGRGGFELDRFALLVVRGGNPVLGRENATAVVFVVADDDRARLAHVLADDHRRAGVGVEGGEAGEKAQSERAELKSLAHVD